MKSSFLFITLFLSLTLDGQKSYETKFGDIKDMYNPECFYGESSASYFSYFKQEKGKESSKCVIEKVNTDLRFSTLIEFNIFNSDDKKGVGDIYLFYYLGNQFLIVHNVYTRTQTFMYLTTYGWDGKPRTRKEILMPKSGTDYEVSVSEDRTKLLLQDIGFKGLSMSKTFTAMVFDEKLEELWSVSGTIKDNSEKYFQYIFPSNSGNLYYTYMRYDKEIKYNATHLVAITDKGEKITELPLIFDGQALIDEVFKVKDDEHIYISGDLAQYRKGVMRLAHLSINGLTMTYNYKNTSKFSDEFGKALTFDKISVKKEDEISFHVPLVKVLMPRADGGCIEFRSSRNALVVTSVSNKGEEEMLSFIPKGNYVNMERLEVSTGYSEVAAIDVVCMPYLDKLYILYNESRDNISEKDLAKMREFDFKQAAIALAVVSKNGTFTREIIFEPEQTRDVQRVFFRPGYCKSYKDGELRLIRASGDFSQNGYFRVVH